MNISYNFRDSVRGFLGTNRRQMSTGEYPIDHIEFPTTLFGYCVAYSTVFNGQTVMVMPKFMYDTHHGARFPANVRKVSRYPIYLDSYRDTRTRTTVEECFNYYYMSVMSPCAARFKTGSGEEFYIGNGFIADKDRHMLLSIVYVGEQRTLFLSPKVFTYQTLEVSKFILRKLLPYLFSNSDYTGILSLAENSTYVLEDSDKFFLFPALDRDNLSTEEQRARVKRLLTEGLEAS